MGQEPGQLREEIEATRDQMGSTVDAIAHRADVPSRVKDSLADKRDRLKAQMSSTTDSVSEATPDVKGNAKQAVGIAQENPLGLAIGGVAVGFLVGLALPVTRQENERLGPLSDELIDKAKETGQEALEHGKQVAQETAEAATSAAQDVAETAKESGQSHTEEVRDAAQEKAEEVRAGGS
jgi:gas vesicle protein